MAECLPTSADLFQHEEHGIGLVQHDAIGTNGHHAVGQNLCRARGQRLKQSGSLERRKTEATPVTIVAKRKQDSTMTEAAVAVVEDQCLLEIHRAIVLVVLVAGVRQ